MDARRLMAVGEEVQIKTHTHAHACISTNCVQWVLLAQKSMQYIFNCSVIQTSKTVSRKKKSM